MKFDIIKLIILKDLNNCARSVGYSVLVMLFFGAAWLVLEQVTGMEFVFAYGILFFTFPAFFGSAYALSIVIGRLRMDGSMIFEMSLPVSAFEYSLAKYITLFTIWFTLWGVCFSLFLFLQPHGWATTALAFIFLVLSVLCSWLILALHLSDNHAFKQYFLLATLLTLTVAFSAFMQSIEPPVWASQVLTAGIAFLVGMISLSLLYSFRQKAIL
ncbi:MAG: hypothetical protein JKY60_07925 [Kordiimonadaceae bacterium]|nr:hypothetical protein [Kordiimonadaceae bacterium]